MLQADLIQNLDLIATEGWEYHKLPLETLNHGGKGSGSWAEKSGAAKSRSRQKRIRTLSGSPVVGQVPC